MVIISKNKSGLIRCADVYDQKKRKVQVRSIAGRYRLVVVSEKCSDINQRMLDGLNTGVFMVLDNKTKRSVIIDTNDPEKVIGIAKSIAKMI